jgi:hypothetical protein
MGRPVWWVRANVPAAEFDDWAAFYSVYPFGPRQEDNRVGVLAELLSSIIQQNAGRGGYKAKPREHWFPSLTPPKGRRSDDGGRAFRAWALSRAPAYGAVRSDTPAKKGRVGRWGQ